MMFKKIESYLLKRQKEQDVSIRKFLTDLIKTEIGDQISKIKVDEIGKAFADQFNSQRLTKDYLIPGIREEIVDFYQKTEEGLELRLQRTAGSFKEESERRRDFEAMKRDMREMKEIIGQYIIKKK